jgi:hypothetical protein
VSDAGVTIDVSAVKLYDVAVRVEERSSINLMTPPLAPQPKHCQRFSLVFTESDGFLSAWKGQRPTYPLPFF